MILLEASPSCTPWQREHMWFAGYVPSELSNKPTFLYYIRYTVDWEIFVVKNISSVTKMSSMLNINIAELLTLHVLWRSDKVRMALLWCMKPVRGCPVHRGLISFSHVKQHMSTFSSVCHLRMSHMHSTHLCNCHVHVSSFLVHLTFVL